jgi:putative DNA primase/helicase
MSAKACPPHNVGNHCPNCGRLDGPLPRFELTEVGDATRFWSAFKDKVRYVHEEDTYLDWNGVVWVRDRRAHATATRRILWTYVGDSLAEERAELLARAFDKKEDEKEARDLRERATEVAHWRKHAHSKAGMTSDLAVFNSMPGITISTGELDRKATLLTFQNGTLDLLTGQLRTPDPAHLVTKQLPFAYDPAARAPKFDGFLRRVVPDPEVREFLQRVFGRTLMWMNERRPVIILSGSGANGKSTLLNAIRSVLGPYVTEADVVTFVEKNSTDKISNDLARMASSRAVFVRELPEGRALDESFVKALTGGDRVQARFLFQEYFEFEPGFLVFLSTNFHPRFTNNPAMVDRVRVVPFHVTLREDERDPRLGAKLSAEKPGVFNWLFAGLKSWRAPVAGSGFTAPAAVRLFTESVAEEALDIQAFFTECLRQMSPDSGRYLASGRVYAVYSAWAKKHGIARPLSDERFGRAMSEAGHAPGRFGANRDRGYADVAVQPEWIGALIDGMKKDPATPPHLVPKDKDEVKEFVLTQGTTEFRSRRSTSAAEGVREL